MSDTYTIKLRKKFWFDRTLKKVKGHFFPTDMNTKQLPVKYMLVVFEDEQQELIDLHRYKGYQVSKELFYIKAKDIKTESNNQVSIAS